MSPRRTAAVAVVMLTLSLAAAGCSSPAPALSDLEADRTTDHPVPAEVTDEALAVLDPDTIRWVGEHEGTDLWLAAGKEDLDACLLVYPDGTDWSVACGGGLLQSTTAAGLTFAVVPDGGTAPAGFEAVSQNVFAAS
ncbi:hypothetical protein QFZ62_001456 [Clavibacter sp. B3I6]|jgi:hypothetical protein|uniref:hypothetical protein n=1 Tax=Clavibacter sp. B3I6 TaxID=3042268 RepID=UPI00277ED791|nr:hypothetical protein [Clavibacter sp. B3I6]MDQ0744148.1 hypothetical protein [Clavibacter sp. B3I6]